MIIFLFLLPLIVYLLFYPVLISNNRRNAALLASLLCSLFLLAIVLGIVVFSPKFADGERFSWTGLTVTGAQSLGLGGSQEQAVVSWPNKELNPSLKANLTDKDSLSIETTGGGAFLFNLPQGKFLNGTIIPVGDGKLLDGKRVNLTGRWEFSQTPQLAIDTPDGEHLLSIKLPFLSRSSDRVLALRPLVEGQGAADPAEAARQNIISSWASDKRLLLTRAGEVRLLGSEKEQMECANPCSMLILWAHSRLLVDIGGNNEQLALRFLPPWRFTSVLPPPSPDGVRRVVITKRARPGDIAFELPLGETVRDPREEMSFSARANGQSVFSGERVSADGTQTFILIKPSIERIAIEGGSNKAAPPDLGLGAMALTFAITDDLPEASRLAWRLALAYICFLFGAIILNKGLRDGRTRWVAFGLITSFWAFLAFRLLLALRFALQPAYLNAQMVKGMTLALVALTAVPGMIMLWLYLRARYSTQVLNSEVNAYDKDAQPKTSPHNHRSLWLIAYLTLLLVSFGVQYINSPRLWSNLPARFVPRPGELLIGMLLTVFFYLVAVIYHLRPANQKKSLANRFSHLLLAPLILDVLLVKIGRRWWATRASQPVTLGRVALYCLLGLCFFGVVPALLSVIPRLAAVHIFFSDLVVPLSLGFMPVLFWLTSISEADTLRGQSGNGASKVNLGFIALLTIVLPTFAVPFFIRDVGKVIVFLALFIPLVPLLLIGRQPRKAAVVAIALLLIILPLSYSYYNPRTSLLPNTARVRLLTFREGANVENAMLLANVTTTGKGLSFNKLSESYEHTWGNKAIAHLGGWWGLRLGTAPVEQARVRRDFIQFDSLYSFYIASEHGLAGGLALLLVYAMPLLLLIVCGWSSRFDFGLSIGIVVASSFLFDAVLHAGMNVGVFPFTGRSMPLINVNSITDLLRWLILFAFVGQALFSRDATRSNRPMDRTDETRTAAEKSFDRPDRLRLTIPVLGIILFHTVLILSVLYGNWKLVRDVSLERPFEWHTLFASIRAMIKNHSITFDQERKALNLNLDIGDVSAVSLVRQEVLRFNALPKDERFGKDVNTRFAERMKGVKTLEDYDRLLADLRMEKKRRPARLFRVLPSLCWNSTPYPTDCAPYRVVASLDFNTRLVFQPERAPEEIPRITFRDRQQLLSGPAWVAGRWIMAYDPDSLLPWIEQMAKGIDTEAARYGLTVAEERYGTITLDHSLHSAAVGFLDSKGREAYRKRFSEALHPEVKGSSPPDSPNMLPPRVALTAISVHDGEVLALGSYPRSNASASWQRITDNSDGEQWLPSANWIDMHAPHVLAALYGGNRNFDLMPGGSTVMPLWASAILAVHPKLDEVLRVRGAGVTERDVFGIELDRHWLVTPGKTWLDFNNYLAQSDSRYHVRLGFAGLAERNNRSIMADGDSLSQNESLDGGRRPWRKYPKFPSSIAFSHFSPSLMKNLQKTLLTAHLEKMYGLKISGSGPRLKSSFWTGDEADDRLNRADLPDAFKRFTPPATNLNLDAIADPSSYVATLLGETSTWSNLELAACFATSVSGTPVVAHMAGAGQPVQPALDREHFPQIAARLRPGLAKATNVGILSKELAATGASSLLKTLAGFKVYSQINTLRRGPGKLPISRVMLEIVKPETPEQGAARSGIVFSMVAEGVDSRTIARWLGEFLFRNREQIERLLNEKANRRDS